MHFLSKAYWFSSMSPVALIVSIASQPAQYTLCPLRTKERPLPLVCLHDKHNHSGRLSKRTMRGSPTSRYCPRSRDQPDHRQGRNRFNRRDPGPNLLMAPMPPALDFRHVFADTDNLIHSGSGLLVPQSPRNSTFEKRMRLPPQNEGYNNIGKGGKIRRSGSHGQRCHSN